MVKEATKWFLEGLVHSLKNALILAICLIPLSGIGIWIVNFFGGDLPNSMNLKETNATEMANVFWALIIGLGLFGICYMIYGGAREVYAKGERARRLNEFERKKAETESRKKPDPEKTQILRG